MCDCPEIQGERSKEGLEVACWITRYLYISKSFDYWTMVKAPHVWLPCQDQIQEMLLQYYGLHSIVKKFWKFEQKMRKEENVGIPSESMEQLWLAFYMDEKHDKIWNGKKWRSK